MMRWMFCRTVKPLCVCELNVTTTKRTGDVSSASTNHISFNGFSCTDACSLHLLHLADARAVSMEFFLFRLDVIHQLMMFKRDAIQVLQQQHAICTCVLCLFSFLFFISLCFVSYFLAPLLFDLYSHLMINFHSL